jgi:Ribonuclease G/E
LENLFKDNEERTLKWMRRIRGKEERKKLKKEIKECRTTKN